MKFTYHPLAEQPEVGKKVAIVEVFGYLYEDRCFAVWDGEKWNFARNLCDYRGVPTPADKLRWREVLSGGMKLRHEFLLDSPDGCNHLWGYGCGVDEGWLYYRQSKMREGMEFDVETVFRYCPICGKKLVLSESENEVELIEETL